jgi:hypothetical protein
MERTPYEKLKPILGDAMCYCIRYWLLHPWLSRKDAYDQSLVYLKVHYKNRGDQRKILEPILHQRKETILLAQVLALKTIPSGDSEGYEMFEENESAQLILTKFLKHRNYKLNKEHLDVLFDMYLYIETLPTGDEKNQFNKFKNIVPWETEEYKEKKRKQEDKKEKAERKKKEAEFRETQRQEKKQRLLLESQ